MTTDDRSNGRETREAQAKPRRGHPFPPGWDRGYRVATEDGPGTIKQMSGPSHVAIAIDKASCTCPCGGQSTLYIPVRDLKSVTPFP